MITWFNEKIADAGFIINLDHRKDRLQSAYKTLEEADISGVERFKAGYYDGGCTQSHIEIAKLQIKNNWDYVLYLEDDIITDIFYDVNDNSDSINLNKVVSNVVKDIRTYKPDVLWLGVRPEGRVKKISNMFVEPEKTVMSHAYLGSLKYAKFLVDNLLWKKEQHVTYTWPIDFFISELNRKQDWKLFHEPLSGRENILENDLKVYMMLPNIFVQGASYSDISNRDEDHTQWIKRCFEENIDIEELNIKKILSDTK